MTHRDSLTYRDSGVDISAGDALVEALKPIAERTRRPGWLDGLGGFGGLFALPTHKYREPVLVSGTDGVGTKLKLAIELARHDTLGIDLVAMCANDIVVTGAEPLFFLDYFASARLDPAVAEAVVRGIGRGCELAGAALIGGETAEMPGLYADGDFDLAGFCVGIVERAAIIDGTRIEAGDAILGLPSSGPHANGYSLIRRILSDSATPLDTAFDGATLGEVLLAPTRIYVRALLAACAQVNILGLAHITGGGIPGNVERILPDGLRATLESSAWPSPAVFGWLQDTGNVAPAEMLRTFNCGLGMVVIARAEDAANTISILGEHGQPAWEIGRIESHTGGERVIVG